MSPARTERLSGWRIEASARPAAGMLAVLLTLGCTSPPTTCAERLRLSRDECYKLMDANDRQRCTEAAQAAAARCAAPS